MFCGGLTVYSPLVRNGCGPGKKVGVVGIGGLGHYALMFAKALGADQVVAISHTDSKEQDALKLGADKFVATGKTVGFVFIFQTQISRSLRDVAVSRRLRCFRPRHHCPYSKSLSYQPRVVAACS